MITLTPAYGRDYKSKKEALEAFYQGKDFILNDFSSPYDGKPCSIRDFNKGAQVLLRYGNLRKTVIASAA